MKCETAQEIIALSVYSELPDDQGPQLEQHLAECEACRRELEAVQALAKAMSLVPVEEPSANLIARSRLRLEEAIDTLPRGSWLLRGWQRFSQGALRLRAAPVAVSAVLVTGLTVGGYSGYRAGEHAHVPTPTTTVITPQTPSGDSLPTDIAGISSIVSEPNTENVEVTFNRVQPETVRGTLDDPQIRQLLLIGTRSRMNTGVRDSSVR